MRLISAKELKRRLDAGESIKLLNALEANRYEAMRIPGSFNYLLKDEIEKNLDKEEDIVVYCTDMACNKSIVLYNLLETMGYMSVTRFAGGIVEWEKEGFPLVGTMVKG